MFAQDHVPQPADASRFRKTQCELRRGPPVRVLKIPLQRREVVDSRPLLF